MAPKSTSLTLRQRIEHEIAGLDARSTELRIALKVVREFGPDDVDVVASAAEPTAEPKRIIVSPTDDVPEAVRSRLADRGTQGANLADKALELERS